MTTGPRLAKHLTGGRIIIVDAPPTHSTKPKPMWFSPRASTRQSNVDIWSSPGDRSRAFPGLSVSRPTQRHR